MTKCLQSPNLLCFLYLLEWLWRRSFVDFFWDAETSVWKGTGIHSGYTVDISIEELAPLTKQIDDDVPETATTVSRFPA